MIPAAPAKCWEAMAEAGHHSACLQFAEAMRADVMAKLAAMTTADTKTPYDPSTAPLAVEAAETNDDGSVTIHGSAVWPLGFRHVTVNIGVL